MSGQLKQRELVRRLHCFGFEGPFRCNGNGHPHMTKGEKKVILPNGHGSHHNDVGAMLIRKILQQAGISLDEWRSKS